VHEAPDPFHVRAFGVDTIVAQAHFVVNFLQEPAFSRGSPPSLTFLLHIFTFLTPLMAESTQFSKVSSQHDLILAREITGQIVPITRLLPDYQVKSTC